jgi:Sec-independent protein secretion pathway component TatC
MSKEFKFSVLFPFLAIILIAAYGGGLGTLFIVLDEVIGIEAVIVLGSSLVFGVPIVAYLLTRNEQAE